MRWGRGICELLLALVLGIVGSNVKGQTFSPTANLNVARELPTSTPTATFLKNGLVLIAGGYNGSYLSSAELYDPANTRFVPFGNLKTARAYHTAILLNTGLVLIVGGYNGAYLAGAELYDPATGISKATGSLQTARAYHTATLLSNGMVLIAGGYNGTYLSSAELYDPSTGTFTATGSLNTARAFHSATLLNNGQVLIAAGYNGTYLSAAELYSSSTGAFTTTGSLNTAREYHAATALNTGLVLVTGGYGATGYLSSAELYNPSNGSFTTTGSLTTARQNHTATLLQNGLVLIAAGYGSSGYLASAEMYNPATATFAVTGSLTTAREYHTATLLTNGQVLVAGGSNGSYLSSAELYNPASQIFIVTGSLTTARSYATATLLTSGLVLVAGGLGASGSNLGTAELYNPATGTFTLTGSLNVPRSQHTATLLTTGMVLIAGGETASADASTSAELYNPTTGTFSVTGSLNYPRLWDTATLLNNGMVLIAGGLSQTLPAYEGTSSAELYNPATGTFSVTGNLVQGRENHTATLLNNGMVLLTGGWTVGDSSAGNSAELYNPNTASFSATGSMNTGRAVHTATLLSNGMVLAAAGYTSSDTATFSAELYNPATATFAFTGSEQAGSDGIGFQTATLLQNGVVLTAGGTCPTCGGSVIEAYLYDPVAGTFSSPFLMNAARWTHTATLLNSGLVLLAGGVDLSSAELFQLSAVQPLISSLVPSSGPVGTSVTIAGVNLLEFGYANTVTFNGVAATPTSWTSNNIVVPVPAGATTGPVIVTVAGIPSNPDTFVISASPPLITAVSPDSGPVGTSVTITGSNFGSSQGTSTVIFNGVAATPTSWSATSIVVPVPTGATSGNIIVTAGGISSTGIPFTVGTYPVISSLSPQSGAVGTSVTIKGTNFGSSMGTSTVTFNGTAATPTSWSATSIVVPVPTGAVPGCVLISVGGLSSNCLIFNPSTGPAVFALSPTSGSAGTSVTITGVDFGSTQSTSTVTFNGTTATPTTWSATTIVVPVPSGASTGNVVISVAGVASNGLPFIVGSLPGITGLSPDQGSVGTSVTITGTNFGSTQGASTVTFDGVPATSTSWSSTEITAPVPTGATTGDVVITTNGTASNGVVFTVETSPAITSVSPTKGPVGTSVTIFGRNFGTTQGTSTVAFNGTLATPSSWTSTTIVVPVPSGATTGQVVVTTAGGLPSNGSAFAVGSAPSITSVSPTSGSAGTSVTITGTNFGSTQGSSTLAFNGSAATVTSWSATKVVAPVPTGASTGPVVVTVAGLSSNGSIFVIGSGPGITSLSASSGMVGSSVTISGVNFGTTQGSSTVTFHGIAATPTSWSSTSIATPVPSGATTGSVIVTVGGQSSNAVNFSVVLPTPTITSLSPTSGSAATSVTISGSNFGAQGSVQFNGKTASLTSWSASSIVATVPSAATTGNVVVTSSGLSSNGVLFVVGSTPGITGLSPASGNAGTSVTITGVNFGSTQGSSTVTFNGSAATVTSWSSTSIVTPVPSGASTGNVIVTVSTTASNGAPFAVGSGPGIQSLAPTAAPIGTPITITGVDFGSTQGSSTVTFNGSAATVTSWSSTSIVVPVPNGATSGNVVVTVGSSGSNPMPFAVVPFISGISLPAGPLQMGFIITGTGFGTVQGISTVTLAGSPLTITSWSAPPWLVCANGQQCITVQVPTTAKSGNIVVTVGGESSNAIPFTIDATFCDQALGCTF